MIRTPDGDLVMCNCMFSETPNDGRDCKCQRPVKSWGDICTDCTAGTHALIEANGHPSRSVF